MVAFCTPSTTPNAGINSPAAWVLIWNLPLVRSLTFLANTSAAPQIVSSDFGKLDASRQRTLAWACTSAGATPAASTPAMPAPWTKERRSMNVSCAKTAVGIREKGKKGKARKF